MHLRRRPVTLTLAATATTVAAALLGGTACSSSTSSSPSGFADSSPSSRAPAAPGSPEDGGESGGGGSAAREGQAAPAEQDWDTSPSSLAAIGDSITRGFDTCSLLADCPEASWATGTDAEVESLARQLLGGGSLAGRTWNLAESGARVEDLADQARRAAEHEPQLVTVLIGANDACARDVASMTSVAAFEDAFTEAVTALREGAPETQIYVSSVPDLMRLWQEGSRSSTARAVWQLASLCPSMLGDAADDSAAATTRREAVRERVREYNAVLAEVCADDPLCRYDGGAVFDYDFTTEHLSSWDWFHPGEEGQRQLAALAYEQVVTDVTAGD
ncbi:GDSL-type esterase/lipase family protein [Streptomyces sp. 4N509B]|uniref:GDSL-type esterase/lipase family protein n=1 Tax=Streptomyces sp. 4N509B TaxID=3457413 RepID=UPI003FD03F14